MKITREYEESDIDLNAPENAPFIMLFTMAMLGSALKKEDADPEQTIKKTIAMMRTTMEKTGYSITKREDVPAVFREDSPSGG